MMKAEGPEGKNIELHTGGKYSEEIELVKEAEENAGVSGNDTPSDNTEVISTLRQIDYSVNQSTQALTVMISILCGLMIGVIFTLWFSKVWK